MLANGAVPLFGRYFSSELSGCQNDAKNIQQYMLEVGKVELSNMTLLIDDGQHTNPTRANIMQALKALTRKVKPGGEALVHYSGHGAQIKDTTGKEEFGFHSTLCPVDCEDVGDIIDNELYKHLVCAMPRGTALTCLFDCCNSGTALDLPYNFKADGKQTEMIQLENFPFGKLVAVISELAAGLSR